MKAEWFGGWRWESGFVGFGLGVDIVVHGGIEITFYVGPLYFGVDWYRA